MKWIVVVIIVAFVALLLVRAVRRLMLGRATIHMAQIKSEADAHQVATILRGLRGMVEVHVNLEQHVATITYRRTKIAIEEIMRALHAAGF